MKQEHMNCREFNKKQNEILDGAPLTKNGSMQTNSYTYKSTNTWKTPMINNVLRTFFSSLYLP